MDYCQAPTCSVSPSPPSQSSPSPSSPSSRSSPSSTSPSRPLALSPRPIETLPDHLLCLVLRAAASDGRSFHHALVCKRWNRVSLIAQSVIHLEPWRDLSFPPLLAAMARFPSLSGLELPIRSLGDGLDDAVLAAIGRSAPSLTHLDLSDLSPSITVHRDGLHALFLSCTRLQQIRLYFPFDETYLTTLPSSFLNLPRLQAIDICSNVLLGNALPEDLGLPHFPLTSSLTPLKLECGRNEISLPESFGLL
ncbi:hypothetical protein CLOM_g8264 [Closterium sp. NIES-68]|nr:hypothetical protein CLOM_g8264 [Closterium sp. NIES-68]